MKNAIKITANLNEPILLKAVVEKLASFHVDLGFTKTTVPQQWKAIETACIQANVRGIFRMHSKGSDTEEQFKVPFASSFLFTCIQGKYGLFNLEWSTSLS